MSREAISISCADGTCPASIFTPDSGTGPWPGVIMFMDAFGIRPALFEFAQRLADAGYIVLLPDLFYRAGPYEPMDPKALFSGGNLMEVIGPLMREANNAAVARDTAGFVDALTSNAGFAGSIGTVGFCMGGAKAIRAASLYPDLVKAAISFHGGHLVTDQPDSVHRYLDPIEGEVYVAVADNDGSYPPEMAAAFEKALDDAGVTWTSELYEGAAHGWMKRDFPVYDEAAAEKGWERMLSLYARTLKA